MTFADLWLYLKESAALIGADWALLPYHRNQRQRRTEWLNSLHIRFYEQPHSKRMRRLLDYQPQPQFTELQKAVESGVDSELSKELVGYLNFFEFLGSLIELKQITKVEVFNLFKYYVRGLNAHPFVVAFVHSEGGDRLDTLLSSRKLSSSAETA